MRKVARHGEELKKETSYFFFTRVRQTSVRERERNTETHRERWGEGEKKGEATVKEVVEKKNVF